MRALRHRFSTNVGFLNLVCLGLVASPSAAQADEDSKARATPKGGEWSADRTQPHDRTRAKRIRGEEPREEGRVTLAQRQETGASEGEGLESFSPRDVALLESGKSVKRRFEITRGQVEYRAGLSYRLVQAKPMDVMRALRRPGGIRKAIPYGIEATTVREDRGFSQVRIVQGKKPVVGEYTVRLKWDLSNYTARFWMDPREEHDIVDVWGVFSAREIRPGWTLVSFGFAFDLGGVAEILESKAQRWALSTADRMAKVVQESLRPHQH